MRRVGQEERLKRRSKMNKRTALIHGAFRKVAILTVLLLPVLLFAEEAIDWEIYINMSLEELMNVKVVTASAKSERIADAPANITVITAQEIENRGYRTVTDIFPDLPGVIMISREPTGSVIPIIKGLYGNRRLKIMINGMEVMTTKASFEPFFGTGAIPVSMIERVEFISGPYSSLYGRNTFYRCCKYYYKTG